MSTFKDKPLKKCHTDNRKMIDDIHQELIGKMSDEEQCEYYLDNGLLLNEYYSNRDDGIDISKNDGILNFFSKDKEKNEMNHTLSKKKKFIIYILVI